MPYLAMLHLLYIYYLVNSKSTVMTILLMLPGSPIPDWLLFLTPLVAALILIQCGQWLYHWFRHRFSHHANGDQAGIPNSNEDTLA